MKALIPFLILASCLPAAERIVCPASADTWVAMHRWEGPPPERADAEKNHGQDAELPIQGRLSFALMAFDISAAKGMTVEKATLRIHRLPAPLPLLAIGISTISGNGPWQENSVNFFRPAEGKAWSYAGSDLVDVTFAQGGSLYAYQRPRDVGDGWLEIDLPAAMAAALITGDQYGLMLCDEKGEIQTRHRLSSRESAWPPVLIVEGSRTDKTAPGRVRSLRTGGGILPSTPVDARRLGRSTLRPGSVILDFGKAGNDAGAGVATRYELRYASKSIAAANFDAATAAPRWTMNPLAQKAGPFATANALRDEVSAVVDGLTPGEVYYFAARAMDGAGNLGPVSALGRYRAYSRGWPDLPAASSAPAPQHGPATAADLRVWAVPELMKIDPKTGALLEQDNFPDHRTANAVWDASSSTVKLTGARNEFLAFQIGIESPQPVAGIEVAVAAPLFAEDKLPPIFERTGAVQLYREWFVPDERNRNAATRPWYPDALIPVKGALDLPSKDNAVPGQTVQPVFVDVYVPHDAAAGKHRGQIVVRAQGKTQPINVEVEVLPLSLPDKLNFVVDLNCYSRVPAERGVAPGSPEYRRQEQAYHRVAQLNRTNLDVLGYSQVGGATVPDHAPPLTGEGAATKVQSWEAWDAHFGPLLDGSEFADLPRGPVPIAAMYLPFFESWPGDLRRSYKFDVPGVAKTTAEFQDLVNRHALNAGPVQEGFSQDYQDRFSAVMADFAEHIRARAYKQTRYLVYFNNKYYYKRPEQGGHGLGWWLFDEPNHRDDVLATNFLAYLTHRAKDKYPDVPILMRTDMSRVEWLRDLIAGMIDLDCISTRFYGKNRYLQDDHNRFGKMYWNYGSTNHPRDTNVTLRAWCWRVWLNGGDGLLPWLAVEGPQAWDRAEPLTVFYTGGKFGQLEPFASLRLKAYRRGQQDMEYLVMLAQKRGWDRDAVMHAVSGALDLTGDVHMGDQEDAGTVSFRKVKDADMDAVRLRVAQALLAR